jgi:hypothetical protein
LTFTCAELRLSMPFIMMLANTGKPAHSAARASSAEPQPFCSSTACGSGPAPACRASRSSAGLDWQVLVATTRSAQAMSSAAGLSASETVNPSGAMA